MRIAFDVSYVQQHRAGVGRYTLSLLEALLQESHHHELILHGWSVSLSTDLLCAIDDRRVSRKIARLPGATKRFYWNRMRVPRLERLIGDFDLFQSADALLPPTGRKKVISVHDIVYKLHPQLLERRVVQWSPFYERAIRDADAIIVPSAQTKLDLQENCNVSSEKIEQISYPICSTFTPCGPLIESDKEVLRRLKLPQTFLLFVGTLEPRKNIPSLIQAFDLLRRQKQFDLALVLVGKKGWGYLEVLEAIARSMHKVDIHYVEYVRDNELASLYRQALCFVYPSLYEGYGFPVVEAMASGLPVITSNNSSLKELGKGAALLIDPSNIEDLADAIRKCSEDSALRASLSRNGLQRAAEIAAMRPGKTLLSLYERLVEG